MSHISEKLFLGSQRISQAVLFTGMIADMTNKLGRLGILPYYLGYGSPAETHIGGFGTATILTGVCKRYCDERVGMSEEWSCVMGALASILLHVGVEVLTGLLGDFSEFRGDVLVQVFSSFNAALAIYNPRVSRAAKQ